VKTKGTDRATQTDGLLSAAGLDILGALRTGIVCVLADGTISAINDAAAEALSVTTTHIGADFWSVLPALHDGRGHDYIAATLRDGTPRVFNAALPGGRADVVHEIRVARTRAGSLVFEIRDATPSASRDSSGEDGEPLRDIAHRMAAGSEPEQLLRVVCDAAREMGGATRATVAPLAG
jgi:PAS domain-containing protein